MTPFRNRKEKRRTIGTIHITSDQQEVALMMVWSTNNNGRVSSSRVVAVSFSIALCCLFCLLSLANGLQLTLTFSYPDANLPSQDAILTLRGSGLGLSWSSGVSMSHNVANQWQYVLNYQASNAGDV